MDSRLTKMTTASAKIQPAQPNISAIKTFPAVNASKSTMQSNTTTTISTGTHYQASTSGPKINITSTTKCEFYKAALDYRVHVHNGSVQTASGLLCKVTAWSLSLAAKMWDIFIGLLTKINNNKFIPNNKKFKFYFALSGSPVVNFNLCSKYAILCSLDGTLRILNMLSGSAVLPVISLTTAAIQCSFVSYKLRLLKKHFTFKFFVIL